MSMDFGLLVLLSRNSEIEFNNCAQNQSTILDLIIPVHLFPPLPSKPLDHDFVCMQCRTEYSQDLELTAWQPSLFVASVDVSGVWISICFEKVDGGFFSFKTNFDSENGRNAMTMCIHIVRGPSGALWSGP
jgi:hypothetical protein